MADGYPGLATMCAHFDACLPGSNWDVVGHDCLSAGAREAERAEIGLPGLFVGVGGLAFAAYSLSRHGRRYQGFLATVDDVLLPGATRLAGHMSHASGLGVGDFDVVSGLSGIGGYLLRARHREGTSAALGSVLEALVGLGAGRGHVPRWWTPPTLMRDPATRRAFPAGNLNCGLAHGIPGPLALLAMALVEGVEVTGQAAAIRAMAEWLIEHRADDSWGLNWPGAVPVESSESPAADASVPTRSAWCYGAPGVARALWLAGKALGERPFTDVAVAAMKAVYRRPLVQRRTDSPTFCHGLAGLLQITLRFARDTQLPLFVEAARRLSEQLLEGYQPDSLLGYVSLGPGDTPVDRPGILDGAAGVALVLLAAATDVEPAWDRLFLLA